MEWIIHSIFLESTFTKEASCLFSFTEQIHYWCEHYMI